MILVDVMDEVAERLEAVKPLHVYAYVPDRIVAPAGIVGWPDSITYDQTYGRGSDRITLPVVVAVARTPDRAARAALMPYCDGAGPRSVKAALESGDASAWDELRVTSVELDVVDIGGTTYAAAMFDLDITGSGG